MHKDNKGFTLVELVVSVALLAIILVPASKFFMDSFRVQSRTAMRTSITRVSQYIMENLRNENYLAEGENKLVLKGNNANNFQGFLKDIKLRKDLEGNYEFIDKTQQKLKEWEIKYKKEGYIVKMELPSFTVSDMKDFEIPDKEQCDGMISIDALGNIYESTGIVDLNGIYGIGTDYFNDPIDNNMYPVICPTLVLPNNDIPSGPVSLWINNSYEIKNELGEKKWANLRIIKPFSNELKVYIEGKKLIVLRGQEGDRASADQTKITSAYVGEDVSKSKKENESKIILEAKMEVISKKDPMIKDIFEFSFPVRYDYSKNEANMLELVIE